MLKNLCGLMAALLFGAAVMGTLTEESPVALMSMLVASVLLGMASLALENLDE